MRVALTGGSGFIGQHIIKCLIANGHSVNLLVNKTQIKPDPSITVIQGHLGNASALEELIKDTDAVIHCAGLTTARTNHDFYRINTGGTEALARIAARANIKKFLLLSSLAARQPELSAYADSKLKAEEILTTIPNLKWDAFRPPAVYGPGDKHFLILLRMLQKGIAPLNAPKGAKLSIIHADDVASAALHWLETISPTEKSYELDDGKHGGYSWQDIYKDVAPLLIDKDPRYIRVPVALTYIIAYISSIFAKIGRKTAFITPGKVNELRHKDWVCHDHSLCQSGWKPSIPLASGFPQTITWYREHKWL